MADWDSGLWDIALWDASVIIDATHDGDFLGKKLAAEKAKADRRRLAIINSYEIFVEGRQKLEEIAEPFTQIVVEHEVPVRQIDFDALFADLDRVEAIWSNYIDMDDEEILTLL